MNGDKLAAKFILRTQWDDFPPEVKRKALLAFMDNVSAVISGARTEVSRVGAAFAVRCFPGDDASIILRGKKAGMAGAAFANGCAANGLDTDDSARYAYGHAGAQIFPTVLAVSEAKGLSGADLLAGMVIGYEVAHRMGRCWHDDHTVYQACGSWGTVACAAAAARLLGLNEKQTQNALGVADYHAPNLPMMRDVANPAMVKHGIGWAALSGILSAELAADGFTGIPSLFSDPRYENWVKDFGEQYIMVDGVSWKAKGYACCGWAHAAVEGVRILLDKYGFLPEEIESIGIDTFKESAALSIDLPRTTEEAQFNLAWPVAAMLVYGEVGPEQTLESGLKNESVRRLAKKVAVRESEELNELCRLFEKGDPRGRFASEVTIELKDGRRLCSGRVGGGLQFPQPGWDEKVMEEKFRWLTEPVIGVPLTDRLVEMSLGFDSVKTVNELTGLIARER